MPSVFVGVGIPSYRGNSNDEDERRRREFERRKMMEEEERRRVMEEYERRRVLEEEQRQRAYMWEEEERQRAYMWEEEERQRANMLEEEERQRRHTIRGMGAAMTLVSASTGIALTVAEATRLHREREREREREQRREERARAQLQDWLRGWSGYDIKPARQPPPPRYDPPEALSSNLARLADDLFPPTAPTLVTSLGTGRSHGRRKGKERRPQLEVVAEPEPTRGVPPGLFDRPDRGFDKLATLVSQISTLAKKSKGHGEVSPLFIHPSLAIR